MRQKDVILDMTDITNIENEIDRYNAIKEYLREFYRGTLTPFELLLIVFLIENPNTKLDWKTISKKMPLYSRASFYRSVKSLKEKGVLGPLECVEGKIIKKYTTAEPITYLLCDGDLYKIGKTLDIESRLKAIHSSNPRVRLVTFTNRDIESELHDIYFENRFQKEWFKFSPIEIHGVLTNFKKIEKDGSSGTLASENEVRDLNNKIN